MPRLRGSRTEKQKQAPKKRRTQNVSPPRCDAKLAACAFTTQDHVVISASISICVASRSGRPRAQNPTCTCTPLVNHPACYLSYCPHRLCSPSLATRDAISHLLIRLPRLSCVRPPGEDPISSPVRTHCSTSEEEEMERLASAAIVRPPDTHHG